MRDARCEMRDARCLCRIRDAKYIMTLVSWPSHASSRFPSASSSSTTTNCFYLLEYRLWLCYFARPFKRPSDLSNLALSSLLSILPFRLAAYSTLPSHHLMPHQIVMPCVESEGARGISRDTKMTPSFEKKNWNAPGQITTCAKQRTLNGRRRLENIRADPSLYQAYLAKSAAVARKYRLEQPRYRWRSALHGWFNRNKDHLSQFTWKRWEPIYYPEKVERTCAACGELRLSGTKLWFRRKSSDSASDSQHEYDCLSCYALSDWSSIAPVQTMGKYRFFEPRNPELIAVRDSLKSPKSAQQEDPK